MIPLWYGILACMLTTYVVLDGRNFGSGILHYVVAKTPQERRLIIAAMGPLWSWHEVWLVGTGGVMLMAFPRFMSLAFSGYYLALFLVLWCVLLRGISIEVGGHLDDPLWRTFWDAVFFASNVLLATLFGAAFGNVIRGMPLGEGGRFYLTFFTNFGVKNQVGLLDWYTLSVALFVVLMLTAHGATYLTMRTQGPVHDRSHKVARGLWSLAAPSFILISILTWTVRPEILTGIPGRPMAGLALLLALGGAVALGVGLVQGREKLALGGSSSLIFGIFMTGAAALYPVMLFSTLGPAHLTAAACAAPQASLRMATYWWFPSLAMALTYLTIIARHYSGKVSLDRDHQGPY